MKNLDENAVRRLQIVAAIVISGFSELDRSGRTRFFEIVDDALADRPESMCRQLATFLNILEFAPILRWGRPLSGLDVKRGERSLRWFQDAPIAKIRQGFWGLKTLIFMGYYGRTEVWPQIGYAPNTSGSGNGDD